MTSSPPSKFEHSHRIRKNPLKPFVVLMLITLTLTTIFLVGAPILRALIIVLSPLLYLFLIPSLWPVTHKPGSFDPPPTAPVAIPGKRSVARCFWLVAQFVRVLYLYVDVIFQVFAFLFGALIAWPPLVLIPLVGLFHPGMYDPNHCKNTNSQSRNRNTSP